MQPRSSHSLKGQRRPETASRTANGTSLVQSTRIGRHTALVLSQIAVATVRKVEVGHSVSSGRLSFEGTRLISTPCCRLG